MNLLIAGDSFGAQWPKKNNNIGWPSLLVKDFNVVNVSQAGVGEYKILKQLESVDLNKFDAVVVNHTSPGRVHTRQHPIHSSGLHKDCDLLYNDIDRPFDLFNRALRSAKSWFQYHYDDQYQIDIYTMLRQEINRKIDRPYLAVSHMPISSDLSFEKNHLDLSGVWARHRGDVNHYDKEGNHLVAMSIENELAKILQ